MNANVIFGMLLAGILSSNYAILHFPGTTAVMVLAGLVCWPVNACLLGGADDFRILAFMALNF